MKTEPRPGDHIAFSFEDEQRAANVVEYGGADNLAPWFTVSTHPRGKGDRVAKVSRPPHRALHIGHDLIFLTAGEFDSLRKSVIDSMIEDGQLIDLGAEAERELVGA